MNHNWPRAVARRIGIGGEIDFTTTRVGQTLHIPCRGRGQHQAHIVDVPIAPGQHPDVVAKKLLGMGWNMGHRLICPDAYKRKEPPMATEPTTQIAPTPAAGRARRLVYMALEEYYDEAKKGYKPNHSDATIAKECGVAEKLVKTIREESYGPLAVPSDLVEIRGEIAQFADKLRDFGRDFSKEVERLDKRITNLIANNGWTK